MTPQSPLNGGRPRWSLPRGRVLLRALRSDPTQAYLLQIPPTGAVDAPVFVSVHGVSRNAHEQARVFSERCSEQGIVLVVPIFTAGQHPDYQRLGRRGRGVRADRLLDRCLAEIVSLTGADVTQFYLFGYSGGAQFAHRYVMAHPHRVVRAVVGAAGWYTFPDHRQRYPYGIRPSRSVPDLNFNPERFLRVPIDVLIGREDTRSSNLRRTKRLEAQQGANRLERARNWVAAMREGAGMYGLPPATTLTEVDGTDHSFSRFCRRGGLVERVFASMLHDDDGAAGEHSEVPQAHVPSLKVIESGTQE
jgi:dienelactone hydrolase